MRESLPLSTFFFDCLLVDEQSLIDQPTTERHVALSEAVRGESLISRITTNDTNEARYNQEAAELAWGRTIEFLKQHLEG